MRLRILFLLLACLTPALEQGRRLLAEGEKLLAREAFDPALRAAREAARLGEQHADRKLAARAASLAGNALNGRGDAEGAKTEHQRALDLARAAGDRVLEASVLADISRGHQQRAEYAAAAENLRRALDLYANAGDHRGEASARAALGRIPYKQGRYDEALAIYQEALAEQERLGDTPGQAETLLDLAVLRSEMRSFAEAISLASRSLAMQESLGSPEGRIRTLCAIAAMYLFQEAPDEALARLRSALAIADAEEDGSLRAKVLYHIGIARLEAGRLQEAIEAFDEAFVVMERDGNLREAAWVTARRGRALEALGRLAEAEVSVRRAIEIWQSIRERRQVAYHHYVLGILLERRGDEEGALRAYRRAMEEESAVRLPYTSLVLTRMSLLLQRRGDTLEGLSSARAAVKAADETGNPEMRWTALFGLGRFLRRAGRGEEALAALGESLSIIESMRHDVAPSDEARTGFMEARQEVYAETLSLSFELGRVEESLEIAERARARAFLDLLAARPGAAGRRVPAPASVAPAGLADIRAAAARRGATLLSYFTGETDLFIWVASPSGSIHGVRSPPGRAEIERLVLRLGAALDNGPFAVTQGAAGAAGRSDIGELEALLKRLHAVLLAPVQKWLPAEPSKAVTIIPHGPLFRVAFGCLLDEAGRYAAESHTLSYTPAVGVLRFTAGSGERTGSGEAPRLLAVGGPAVADAERVPRGLAELPGAVEEARGIAAIWPAGRSTLLLAEGAREIALRDLAPRFSILHLASHGVVLDESPLSSYVALTRGDGTRSDDDGALTVAEVLDLDLKADLVTLSACDTGRGRITGDGVLGLSRAFVYAGASSVVVSLWRVADVVGRFQMERFYQALAAGKDKAPALRRAQLDTLAALRRGEIRTPEGRALRDTPALWASFVLIGEPR